MVGHDFLAFYTAGSFVRDGRMRDLYDLEKVKTFQHELAAREGLKIGESFGPFWNPPFYAWVFRPLAALPYRSALAVWWTINAFCLIGALVLLVRMLGATHWSSKVATVLLVLVSMPAIQAFTHGQNTFISLLILTIAVTFWRGDRPMLAGMSAGLLAYKPQLGAVIMAAIVLTSGWRALAGIAITGSALFLATVITMPGMLEEYHRAMPGNLHQFQVVQPYLWERHVTLRAFWRLLLQGRMPGEMAPAAKALWYVSCAGVVVLLARTWSARTRDRFMAAVIVAMPLLMPFYFDYDLLLVAVSAVLVAPRGGRLTFWCWAGLFVWMMANPSLARLMGVNGTVLWLGGIVGSITLASHDPQSPLKLPSKNGETLATVS
jgi:hypothetical protein